MREGQGQALPLHMREGKGQALPLQMRRAKILATIGPASRDPQVFEAMLAAGGGGGRLNIWHGNYKKKGADIQRARAAAEKMGRPLAVLVDLSGPKIRTRSLKDHQPVELKAAQVFTITTQDIEGDNTQVATTYDGMTQDFPR